MLCTYLYKMTTRELELLEPGELQSLAPNEAETVAKSALMKEKKYKGVAHRGRPQCHSGEMMWIDVTDPSADDYALLRERFSLHPMVLEDIRAKEGRPKLHSYGDYLYLIFFAIKWKAKSPRKDGPDGDHFEMEIVEIDCLVGADYVVTIHNGALSSLDDLRDRWLRRPEMMQSGAGHLLYEIMDEVLDDYFPLLDALDEHIDEFEERLFANKEDEHETPLSTDIFALKRNLIQVRRIAGPTRDVVNLLMRHDADTGNRNFAYYQDLYDHSSRIVDQIDNFREILAGALDAYLATESNRMNQVMKTLTACSIILLVPNLIAAIYGMNFDDLPKSHGFYGSIGAMVTLIGGLFAYFKHLKWL